MARSRAVTLEIREVEDRRVIVGTGTDSWIWYVGDSRTKDDS